MAEARCTPSKASAITGAAKSAFSGVMDASARSKLYLAEIGVLAALRFLNSARFSGREEKEKPRDGRIKRDPRSDIVARVPQWETLGQRKVRLLQGTPSQAQHRPQQEPKQYVFCFSGAGPLTIAGHQNTKGLEKSAIFATGSLEASLLIFFNVRIFLRKASARINLVRQAKIARPPIGSRACFFKGAT